MSRSSLLVLRASFTAGLASYFALAPLANAKPPRTIEPARSVRQPATPRAIDGRVVEVRRGSHEVTVRTSRGTLEHVVVTATSVIHAPHGSAALSGIRAGMPIHAEGRADSSRRLVARTISAR